jgi:hypothetical protein
MEMKEPEESQEYYASMQYDRGGEMDFMSDEFESKVKDIYAKPKSTQKTLPATKRTKNAFGLLSFEQLSEIFNVELFGLNERETEKMLEELHYEWNDMSENDRIGFLNANGIKYAKGGYMAKGGLMPKGVRDGKNQWLIEWFHWEYLLDEIEVENKRKREGRASKYELVDDWRVAKQTIDGEQVENSPYSARFMYSPSLDKLREQTESEWYSNASVSDTLAKGGTFDSKVNAIAKKLEGKPVPAPYRKEYGTRYDKEDAKEAASRIVGNMRKMYGE